MAKKKAQMLRLFKLIAGCAVCTAGQAVRAAGVQQPGEVEGRNPICHAPLQRESLLDER